MADWLTVRTGDGHDLEVLRSGPADGFPLVMHGGTPSAAYEIPQVARAVTDRGWQLVTYSRPGYAGSTVQPGRTVADAAADVVAVLVHLGLDRFVTLGWSGGGPHALACAALLPGRCAAAATLAGVAPYGAEGLDCLEEGAGEPRGVRCRARVGGRAHHVPGARSARTGQRDRRPGGHHARWAGVRC